MKGRRKADLQTLDLFAAPADGDSMALSTTDWLAALERLADAGCCAAWTAPWRPLSPRRTPRPGLRCWWPPPCWRRWRGAATAACP
jgi:hypothetical protein